MIEMGDPKNKGYIKLDGFLKVMNEIGLIPDKEQSVSNGNFSP